MSSNAELSKLFGEIAQLLELTGADRFRVNAHAKVSRVVDAYPQDLVKIAQSDDGVKTLKEIEGIGAKTAEKIVEFAETGKISEHDELLQQVPQGLIGLLGVPGLGPKTIKALWDTLNVTSVDDLKRVIDDGSIMQMPRMGAKTVENIKEALSFQEKAGDRTPLGIAAPIAFAIAEKLRAVKGVKHAEPAGSLRRGRETIGDLDFIVGSEKVDPVMDAFVALPGVTKVLARGDTKCSVRLEVEGKAIQADLRVVPPSHYGAALLYFTGSKEHNVRLRERALKHGMTLNEYGLYTEDDEKTPPQHRGVRPLAASTEEAIYTKLGLPYLPPELREDHALSEKQPPKLIELSDIKAELHAHTTASDGVMSIVELATQAKARGFHTIAVTDHSVSSAIANGLSIDRLLAHIEAIHAARSEVKGITILAGSEVDILVDGRLDYPDKVLEMLDVVVASPHASLKQEPAKATARLLSAIRHPLVHILGHPTGRLINKREGLHPDITAIAEAAAEHKVALEINSNWMRLDLRDQHVAIALNAGAMIAIDCDVHYPADYDQLPFGVTTGRRGGLTASSCVNTWSASKLHSWLKSKR